MIEQALMHPARVRLVTMSYDVESKLTSQQTDFQQYQLHRLLTSLITTRQLMSLLGLGS